MTNATSILQKIKGKGYWRIVTHPLVFKVDKISSLSKCEELVKNAQVELRGWPYPFYDYNIKPDRGQDWIQVAIDFEYRIELWRMYLSGQFTHYMALEEDWFDYASIAKRGSRFQNIKQGDILGFDFMVYQITEFFEFISRLSKQELYQDGLKIQFELVNTANRRLFMFDFRRVNFMTEYKTSASRLTYLKEIDGKNALNNSQQNALDSILFFADRFGWESPNIISIKDIQQKLLERRL